jgi:hypothetical protein
MMGYAREFSHPISVSSFCLSPFLIPSRSFSLYSLSSVFSHSVLKKVIKKKLYPQPTLFILNVDTLPCSETSIIWHGLKFFLLYLAMEAADFPEYPQSDTTLEGVRFEP